MSCCLALALGAKFSALTSDVIVWEDEKKKKTEEEVIAYGEEGISWDYKEGLVFS